jgi:hypothetical protein
VPELEYVEQFRKYESARSRYAELQESLRDFLARFTGNPNAHESPMSVRDLATLEGLRVTRDIAFAEYALAEARIIRQLLAALPIREPG